MDDGSSFQTRADLNNNPEEELDLLVVRSDLGVLRNPPALSIAYQKSTYTKTLNQNIHSICC